MSSRILKAFGSMYLTGALLTAAAVPQAVKDLQDLKTVVDAAAATINAAPNNSTWGFLTVAPQGSLGTADLVANITTTVLRANYLLQSDKDHWLAANDTNVTSPTPTPPTPPPFPTTTAPSTLTGPNSTVTSLDEPYTTYILSLPSLATALTTLGRSWHKEMNQPVYSAIDALQQTISTFQSSLLEAQLIGTSSVLRTIRASSSLEDAQQAWSRFLNLPGSASSSGSGDGGMGKRSLTSAKRPLPFEGGFYRHKDLWGRGPEARESREGKARMYDAVVRWEEQHGGRQPRPFVA